MTTLIKHLEAYAGPVVQGWESSPNGVRLPFQIVELAGPFVGVHTLTTLGLSNTPLVIDGTDMILRVEYVMLFRTAPGCRNLPAVLQQVAIEALERGNTYQRGHVIGPRDTLVDGFPFTSLYVAKPVYFSEHFGVYMPGSAGQSVTFIWLVPITAREAGIIRKQGWEYFERRLEEVDPDLTDFTRMEVT